MPFHATGAATASRLFNEALAKIAMNAQQSGTGDIGKRLRAENKCRLLIPHSRIKQIMNLTTFVLVQVRL